MKICHNLMLGVVAQCMAEITVLAEKGGVSRADFLAFLNDSVMGSTFTRYKSPAYVNLDFTPTFTPALLLKDFQLGFEAARELGVPMPLAAMTEQIVQGMVALSGDEVDFAALLELEARASGLELVPEDVEVDDGLSPIDASANGGSPRAAGQAPAAAGTAVGRQRYSSSACGRSSSSRTRAEEARAVDAVEDPVIAREREDHRRARDELARDLVDERAPLERADREDRRLRRVDHRREAVDAVHPEVRDGERPAGELGRRDRAVAHARGEPRAARPISPSDFWSASKIVGTTSAFSAATAMPTLTRE